MFYSYAISPWQGKPPQLGLYLHPTAPPVIVTHDESGTPVALCSDKSSVERFSDQMGGWITGQYKMANSSEYWNA